MPTEHAAQALANLRTLDHFSWNVVPILVLCVYVYAVEIERRNWSVVYAGLALWGVDWFNEIWNSLVFHFTQYAPLWAAPGETTYLILIGLNVERYAREAELRFALVRVNESAESIALFGGDVSAMVPAAAVASMQGALPGR